MRSDSYCNTNYQSELKNADFEMREWGDNKGQISNHFHHTLSEIESDYNMNCQSELNDFDFDFDFEMLAWLANNDQRSNHSHYTLSGMESDRMNYQSELSDLDIDNDDKGSDHSPGILKEMESSGFCSIVDSHFEGLQMQELITQIPEHKEEKVLGFDRLYVIKVPFTLKIFNRSLRKDLLGKAFTPIMRGMNTRLKKNTLIFFSIQPYLHNDNQSVVKLQKKFEANIEDSYSDFQVKFHDYDLSTINIFIFYHGEYPFRNKEEISLRKQINIRNSKIQIKYFFYYVAKTKIFHQIFGETFDAGDLSSYLNLGKVASEESEKLQKQIEEEKKAKQRAFEEKRREMEEKEKEQEAKEKEKKIKEEKEAENAKLKRLLLSMGLSEDEIINKLEL